MTMVRSAVIALLFVAAANVVHAADSMTAVIERVRKKHPTVQQMSTADLARILEADSVQSATLLDVREEREFNVSHLKGARRAATIEEALDALGDVRKDALVVAYCSVGYRSSELAEKLGERGFTNVFNLEGSLFQWANEDRAVYRDDVRVHCVHPYNRWWGRLLKRELRDCPAEEPHSE